jgi:hypothetical protein
MQVWHHIYVDYENVQSVKLALIAGKPATVTLVLGSRQNSLPLELTKALLDHATQVRLVETKASGKNALDFVLACELGGRCATQPMAEYHIISKDKGFDAIIEHLTGHGIRVTRHESFDAVPLFKPAGSAVHNTVKKPTPPTLDGRVTAILDKLAKLTANRPAKTKTLLSTIHAHFEKELSVSEVQAIVDKLTAQKKIRISTTGAVTYAI